MNEMVMTRLREVLPVMTLAGPARGLEVSNSVLGMAADERRLAMEQVRSGELTDLSFKALTFRAAYPNRNFFRFREEEMAGFAQSFGGTPFLYDHRAGNVDSRHGTVVASALRGDELVQEILLTTQAGMLDYLERKIDRFSIGWYYQEILCSITGENWFKSPHWPGEKVQVDGREVVAEIIWAGVEGKEVSAVNAPAVKGTGLLSELIAFKEEVRERMGKQVVVEKKAEAKAEEQVDPKDVQAAAADAAQAAETDGTAEAGRVNQHKNELAEQQEGTPIIAGEAGGGVMQNTRGNPPISENGHGSEAKPAADTSAGLSTGIAALRASLAEAKAEVDAVKLDALLAQSGLSQAGQDAVRLAMEDAPIARASQLIEAQRGVEQTAAAAHQVHGNEPMDPGPSSVGGVLTSLDKIRLATEAMIDGVRPEQGVRPLTGVRELYTLLSGDFEMTGKFMPENVGLANVNTTTMAGLVADALNKRVVNMFQAYPRFWEPVVSVEDFTSLQQVKWITVGGIGELDDVPEGAAYTEKNWGDQTEIGNWVKKGNFLGLTLEAIDRDDTRRLQQTPRALAQAAWMSLGKAFTRLFTTPPVMSDGKALFHVDHNNLGSSPLSYAAFDATRTLMAAQTELNSDEPLGGLTVPRYLMVSRAREGLSLQVLASEGEPGTANNDVNPYASGNTHEARLAAAKRRVIVNDFLAAPDDWYAIADPMMYPSVGLGFRYGRTPEIISTADPGAYYMFTQDVMPIKVRWFFVVGPTDWRGVYKHVVV